MMPAHYALSDAAIVLVAIWAGIAMWRKDQWLAAMAMACFGIPAAVGVIRLGAGLQVELAALHAGASQLLGLTGAITLAAACLPRTIRWSRWIVMGAALIIAGVVVFLAKPLLAPLFIAALLVALGAALRDAVQNELSRLVPSGLMILLANALFIRGAAWLSEAAAWHAYHVLIALALAVLAKGLLAVQRSTA
jgi:hypothetical protein